MPEIMGPIRKTIIVSGSGEETDFGDLAEVSSTVGVTTTVNSGTASVELLAANDDRKGAAILNTDVNILYVDLSGGTASATHHSHQLSNGQTIEVPFGYKGLITGIWAGNGDGVAIVTEFE